MSQEAKLAKLVRIRGKIKATLTQLDQLESERLELYEATDTIEIELSKLRQKESKLLAKIKPI